MNRVEHLKIIQVPTINDTRGNLAVIEKDCVPFEIKRVYYLFDIPTDSYRGGHAHIEQLELLIALSGSFDVVLDDGKQKKTIMLNKPNIGLLIPTMVWRELQNFSSGAVCLVLASDVFDEADYVRDYEAFKSSAL